MVTLNNAQQAELNELRKNRIQYKMRSFETAAQIRARVKAELESEFRYEKEVIEKSVVKLKAMGVPVSQICEAYGSRDAKTITDIVKRRSGLLQEILAQNSTSEAKKSPYSWVWFGERDMNPVTGVNTKAYGWCLKAEWVGHTTVGKHPKRVEDGWCMYAVEWKNLWDEHDYVVARSKFYWDAEKELNTVFHDFVDNIEPYNSDPREAAKLSVRSEVEEWIKQNPKPKTPPQGENEVASSSEYDGGAQYDEEGYEIA